MLYTKTDSSSYIQQFKRKLTNFADKAPLLMSFTTTPKGVQIVNEATDDVYEVEWDFSVPVKSFIYGIKQVLLQNNAYPILIKQEKSIVDVPSSEQIEMASQGIPVEQIPTRKEVIKETKILIDKIIPYRDIFIIEDMETNKKYRYHMKMSSVLFLKRIRSHALNSRTAAKIFFDKSELMNEIFLKEEVEE